MRKKLHFDHIRRSSIYKGLVFASFTAISINLYSSFDPELYPEYSLIPRAQSLQDSGAYVVANYTSDAVTNPVGGRAKGFVYCDSYFLGLGFDFGKKTPLTGLSLNSSFVFRTGHNLTSKIDNQFSVNQVYGGQTWRIYSLFLEQKMFDDLIDVKIGRFAPSDNFLASTLYYRFINNSINGTPVAILYNVPFATYPNGVWGAYFSVKPNRHFIYKTGVYSTNYFTFANKNHGFNWTFNSPFGVLLMNEACLMTGSLDQNTNMPGNYKLGLAYQFSDVTNHSFGVSNGNYSLYFLADQVALRLSPTRFLTPFCGFLYTPPQKAVFPIFTFGGFAFDGLFAKRSQDVLSYVCTCALYSSSFQNFSLIKQNYEIDMELNYQFNIKRYFNITPSIQYIINPKGLNSIPNAWVLGVQTFINF